MTKLEKVEREIEQHRESNCRACTRAVQDVTAPNCPIAQELYREAREAFRRGRRR